MVLFQQYVGAEFLTVSGRKVQSCPLMDEIIIVLYSKLRELQYNKVLYSLCWRADESLKVRDVKGKKDDQRDISSASHISPSGK
jgi:hypothetical protein